MYENPDENRQIHQNVYTFSNFRRFLPEKFPLFLDFANSHLPLKMYPFLRESGYECGIHLYILFGSGGGGGGGGGGGQNTKNKQHYGTNYLVTK